MNRGGTGVGARLRATKLSVVAMIGAVALSGCDFSVYDLPLPGGTDTGDQPIEVMVEFRDVLDLVPQSTVKVNDVNVGKVTQVELDGQTADVTVELRKDVDLPDNAEAKIRQTSLLGEKFVSLTPPVEGASTSQLGDGDVIPLERSGANPDVEEVLGALSLLLNGGGVAQLRTIARELNLALEGRESETKSALNQIDSFVTQLDDNKATIITAIEDVNKLSKGVRQQLPSIENALEELPSALLSLDRQRNDLIRMLTALDELSDVGVRVIRQSKDVTIQAFRQLQPTLTQLADSGDAFVDAFNVFLTYPFVDEVVGRDPQVARSLRQGDYTNLSVQLDLDLTDLQPVGLPCTALEDVVAQDAPELNQLLSSGDLCEGANETIQACLAEPSLANCQGLPAGVLTAVCSSLTTPIPGLCEGSGDGGGNGGGNPVPNPGDVLPDTNLDNVVPDANLNLPSDSGPRLPRIPGLPSGNQSGLGLNRPGFEGAPAESDGISRRTTSIGELMDVMDPALTQLLMTPVVAP